MSLGRGLRTASHVRHCIQQNQSASSSRIQWECRRSASNFFNPLQWIQEKFQPTYRQPVKQETLQSQKERAKEGQQSVFEVAATQEKKRQEARTVIKGGIVAPQPKKHTEHKYSTANFKISHRKLNKLGRQISGMPIDHAIMQMQFSEKRASDRIKSMLATAKDHAIRYKNLESSKLIVAEAWVSKGPKSLKRFEPKGRAKYGIRVHPDSRINVVLKEGKTFEEKKKAERERRLKKIVSAGLVREDVPLRNPSASWQW
ncbi:hypothetical protein SERLA73DRAFT_98399 [Serpula lacrymans var. lacrymans S7.3]|uniref:Ribosomal protein L22 n=2 Tax=Serpula lacrymans var. lacrymans TaxID=341189 RepID=F8QF89_SERL3|nr:uncharacterized protein SERLADRAFT_462082 [Serpula lacrymans var. lacrymans S7.9]EGN93048.1 hypothetical protein SERLA73DRAFT_98399 [Serpula lacrymans var. lacrymans S7.3]EGO27886.1 hypothetical protein SERLADRAFT_462082 [Serpula lacrymans var. lacrymans S7.9]